MTNKKSKWLLWIAILSTFLSILVHVYLTQHHYNFKYGHEISKSFCNLNETFNCDQAVLSPYSEFFGIPISIFGGLFGLTLFCLLVVFHFPILSSETSREFLKTPLKLLSLGILLASLIMAGLSVFDLKTICPFCAVAYILSFISFLCLWIALGRGLKFSGFDVKLFGITFSVILFFAILFHHNILRRYGGKELKEITKLQMSAKEITKLQMSAWDQAGINKKLTEESFKAPDIKKSSMTMVEFADFLCPHCARAFVTIHKFIKKHPDVNFHFQAFPLDRDCNSSFISSKGGSPCLLARLSYCAKKQSRQSQWKTQSWIFENQQKLITQEKIRKKLKDNLQFLELDGQKLMACLDSEEAKKAIEDQVSLGQEVGISGTPSLYINGKEVPQGFSLLLLEQIHSKLKKLE